LSSLIFTINQLNYDILSDMKKSVLVTGGEKRIGAAIAAELRARGWRVLTSSHRGDADADIVADLSQPSGAAELYLKALGLEPELSAIVNNAALFAGDESDLRMVNLESPKKLTMMLAGREDAKCAVVNVLDAEVLCANACQNNGIKGIYLETKRELLEYTRKSACLFAETMRVNAVAPGPVFAPEGVHEKAGEILLDRRPSAEDVASAVAFLLETPSITGAVVPVDSGQHLLD
jgi:NAD(P)-dependent dehydrogenase (short-subunit alcohol dehydrogenase family)